MVFQVIWIFGYLACLAVSAFSLALALDPFALNEFPSLFTLRNQGSNFKVAKNMLSNPAKPLFLREIFTVRVAVLLNFGWVTVASILAFSVCFKKFQTPFANESIWAIAILCVALFIFVLNSVLYGGFIVGGVFVFVNVTLFSKYTELYEESKRNQRFLALTAQHLQRPTGI